MEKSEIINGNKMIADFMGIVRSKSQFADRTFGYMNVKNAGNYHESELEYNTSWDWLIPVVKKIKTTVMNKASEVTSAKLHGNINIQLMSVEIENVYKSVIDFIQSFNERGEKI